MKDNVIQFPMDRVKSKLISEEQLEFEDYYMDMAEESTELAQHVLLLIEEILKDLDLPNFRGIDFRTREFAESRDMMVVVNMIASMLMRFGGIHHFLQPELEILYDKLLEMQDLNDFT